MTNVEYFKQSCEHLEPMFDPFYIREKLVIPPTRQETNELTSKCTQLIKLISAFDVLINKGIGKDDTTIKGIVDDVILILNKTKGINLFSFVTFFCTYNANYEVYKKLKGENKYDFIFEMLRNYCKQRHNIYLSHGYSHSMLQTISDSHAHKAKSKSGINKIEEMVAQYGITRLISSAIEEADNYYFLPDKGDPDMFTDFLQKLKLEYAYGNLEQNKLPDMVLKFRHQYFIIEMKNMKEGGGGQNKQIAEVVNFIRFQESRRDVHYMTFLDGVYFNELITSSQPKMKSQYDDTIKCLTQNTINYFVNTYGFELLLKDMAVLSAGAH